MPAYHKLLLGESVDMSYHLSGYGVFKEESLIRVLGEGIERYALLVAPSSYRDKIEYFSYNDAHKHGEVVPWEYIRVFSDADYAKLKDKTFLRPVDRDTTLGWLRCPSIFDSNRWIYVPAQLLFIGYRVNADAGEVMFSPGFSKGSASHTDFKKALKSAIMESVEADALMLSWYAKPSVDRVLVDDYVLSSMMGNLLGNSDYGVDVLDFSQPDLPGSAFAVSLTHEKAARPYVVMGCQASLDPKGGVYRAFMEALAILYLANNGALVMPQDYLETTCAKDFLNLDSNVAWWADPTDAKLKADALASMVKGERSLGSFPNQAAADDDGDLRIMLQKLSKVSSYGVYLDITPPEIAKDGWRVARTFFPELVQMSFPGVPYSDHPRIKEHGGVRNELPHPLP